MRYIQYILTLGIVTLLFVSCATQRNADKFYQKHPEKLAQVCAEKFPIKDSTGEPVIDSSKKADNKDYTGQIDSLQKLTDILLSLQVDLAKGDTAKATTLARALDIIAEKNRKEIAAQEKIKQLAARVSDLQANYRPCESDTVYSTKTVYRENTAKIAAQAYEIAGLKTQLTKAETQRDDWKGKAKQRFWWLIAVITVLGIGILLKIKRVI